ncbi:MAG TPA: tRNA (guanosine(37)-N1)-methyltransferase TrmD [Deltaproteobacteria bacterium]|nr:tRNA (guanosine(37)-N1)-methyltransferase TrmD [Deltaproteobacteria bacterium]
MIFHVLTLFPDFFSSPLKQSIIGRAIERGILKVALHNIRDYAKDKHRTVDDTPYGGGAGMVLKVEPVVDCLEAVRKKTTKERTLTILTTPQGVTLRQPLVERLSGYEELIILCGRYEGIDERIRAFVDMEVSIGDYILTGGEIAALVIIDSVGRLVPGVVGEADSLKTESFSEGLLEYPQYTRPPEFRGMKVPEVLLSGHHEQIRKWRRKESLKRTLERRPDLLERAELTEEDRKLIKELTEKG